MAESEEEPPRPSMDNRKDSQPEIKKDSVFFEKPLDLDDVLVNELGQFGWYQVRNLLLISLPVIMSAFMVEYIFSAAAIPHRCRITECGEYSQSNEFEPSWVPNAIPTDNNDNMESCQRFVSQANGTLASCPANLFTSDTTDCNGEFVYARDNSVVYDFNLGCQDWLRALAGTLSSVGGLVVLPIAGYVSDKFGRRVALIISVFNLALIGLIRAFSVNYPMYLVLQFLQTALGGGTISTSYILIAEFVGPRYRVMAGATCCALFATGQIILGAVAWIVQPWRYMIMTLHIPCFIIIAYYWFLDESVRWLLAKGKYAEAKYVLEKIARVNKKEISKKSINALLNPPALPVMKHEEETVGVITAIFRSSVLLRRVMTTPIWWITTTFVYYGLSINAVSLSDTMYLTFILTCAIEIPGYYTAVFVLDKIGRKSTLSCGFFLSAVCNIAFVFIPSDLSILRLIIYLLGKFGISAVFASLYLYTSELYPTQYRHSLLGFSSMVGRIGSVTAPVTPVLGDYWHGIPSLMFAVMGVISGLLVLTQPETLGTKMPDTLAEAEAIGKPESMRQNNK